MDERPQGGGREFAEVRRRKQLMAGQRRDRQAARIQQDRVSSVATHFIFDPTDL